MVSRSYQHHVTRPKYNLASGDDDVGLFVSGFFPIKASVKKLNGRRYKSEDTKIKNFNIDFLLYDRNYDYPLHVNTFSIKKIILITIL